MLRHQRISFSSQQRSRHESTSRDYNAVCTPGRQLEKTLRKKSEFDRGVGSRVGPHTNTHGEDPRGPAWKPFALGSRMASIDITLHLTWLALNHDVGYARELEHVTGYVQARQTEACTRNALRGAHTATASMEEVSGVEQASKKTPSQFYSVIQREILADALPGKPAKQASRMCVLVLSMLEEVVLNAASLVYHRIYAWWILWEHSGLMTVVASNQKTYPLLVGRCQHC